MALFIARREIHQTFWISRTFALFSSPRFSIFLALSASHHLATLRLALIAAKNLESLPNLVLRAFLKAFVRFGEFCQILRDFC